MLKAVVFPLLVGAVGGVVVMGFLSQFESRGAPLRRPIPRDSDGPGSTLIPISRGDERSHARHEGSDEAKDKTPRDPRSGRPHDEGGGRIPARFARVREALASELAWAEAEERCSEQVLFAADAIREYFTAYSGPGGRAIEEGGIAADPRLIDLILLIGGHVTQTQFDQLSKVYRERARKTAELAIETRRQEAGIDDRDLIGQIRRNRSLREQAIDEQASLAIQSHLDAQQLSKYREWWGVE